MVNIVTQTDRFNAGTLKRTPCVRKSSRYSFVSFIVARARSFGNCTMSASYKAVAHFYSPVQTNARRLRMQSDHKVSHAFFSCSSRTKTNFGRIFSSSGINVITFLSRTRSKHKYRMRLPFAKSKQMTLRPILFDSFHLPFKQ